MKTTNELILNGVNRLRSMGDALAGQIMGSTRMPGYAHADALSKLRNQAIAIGLKKMFEHKHFSLCTLEVLLASARLIPDGELMLVLRPLHCVDWSDMPAEFRLEIQGKIIGMFTPIEEAHDSLAE